MAPPKTGVIKVNIRIVKNNVIVINGKSTRRFRKPEDDKTRRVINRLVNEIVVLIPAKITAIIIKSCAPNPVYFKFPENGVINVQPATTAARFEHLLKNTFRRRPCEALEARYQNDSGNLSVKFQNNNLYGVKTEFVTPSKFNFLRAPYSTNPFSHEFLKNKLRV
jgi:hypothetical protein